MSPPPGTRIGSRRFTARLVPRTARLRLALLYGCVSFACGAGLLAITYLLVSQNGSSYVRLPGPPGRYRFGRGNFSNRISVGAVSHGQHATDLHTLLLMSAIALALMAAVSALLGWVIAGRVLRPLRTITSTAREISATNLHRRLALPGPDDELKELGDTLDALLGRLEGAFDAQRRFVANASHELRTPLARLKTLLQVALTNPDATATSLRFAQTRALVAEEELEDLIDALLALASGEQAIASPEPLDLGALTCTALETRASEVEQLKLRVDVDLGHAWTDGNRRLLERLISNLVDNAIEHNTHGGWLEIATSTRKGRAVLSVANSGAVVPADELDRLKQPFQRLATGRASRSHGHGLGLGLSIVAAVASAHGGTLDLRSRPEGGLDVRVELLSTGPLLRPATELAEAPQR